MQKKLDVFTLPEALTSKNLLQKEYKKKRKKWEKYPNCNPQQTHVSTYKDALTVKVKQALNKKSSKLWR